MRSYEELMKRALIELEKKKESVKTKRFEIPKVSIVKEGAKTVIKNFSQIAKILNRKEEHLYKYLVKSLGTAGMIENERLILQGKFSEEEIQKEIDEYVKLYVLCKECGVPDTELMKEERVTMLRCQACGAKQPVRSI
ncbi:MAG: translation initiation factor IF-2 subunit beta [Archaeoglobaceae archaeon]|nr:translation initiation factor IF-2 subunit beta [Archaeoglobaceae archaeon]MCX8152364.1 translation initiation factor IF-2 subunit beta [Archaeoglobaceae archaeon]MDW8014177.1 translation initiation factor IF-2 subunit beta [Archaeoglobaceae archaeon]